MLHAAHRTWMGASQNHLRWTSTAGTLAHLGAQAAQSLDKHRGLSVDVRAPHDARLLEGLVLFRLVPERGGVLRVMIITTLLPQSFSGGGLYSKGHGLWL